MSFSSSSMITGMAKSLVAWLKWTITRLTEPMVTPRYLTGRLRSGR